MRTMVAVLELGTAIEALDLLLRVHVAARRQQPGCRPTAAPTTHVHVGTDARGQRRRQHRRHPGAGQAGLTYPTRRTRRRAPADDPWPRRPPGGTPAPRQHRQKGGETVGQPRQPVPVRRRLILDARAVGTAARRTHPRPHRPPLPGLHHRRHRLTRRGVAMPHPRRRRERPHPLGLTVRSFGAAGATARRVMALSRQVNDRRPVCRAAVASAVPVVGVRCPCISSGPPWAGASGRHGDPLTGPSSTASDHRGELSSGPSSASTTRNSTILLAYFTIRKWARYR